jgi:hypothetical protein
MAEFHMQLLKAQKKKGFMQYEAFLARDLYKLLLDYGVSSPLSFTRRPLPARIVNRSRDFFGSVALQQSPIHSESNFPCLNASTSQACHQSSGCVMVFFVTRPTDDIVTST